MIKNIAKRKKFLIILGVVVVAIALVLALQLRPKVTEISDTLPKDGETEVQIGSDITIQFTDEVPDDQKESLFVSIEPRTEFDLNWRDLSLEINPKYGLIGGTKYNVVIQISEKELVSFTFQTVGVRAEDIEEIARQQSIDDLEFGQTYRQILEEDPWYGKLPIETNRYTIVYDNVKAAFRIRLKQTPINEEARMVVVEEALELLKEIGAPAPAIYNVVLPSN